MSRRNKEKANVRIIDLNNVNGRANKRQPCCCPPVPVEKGVNSGVFTPSIVSVTPSPATAATNTGTFLQINDIVDGGLTLSVTQPAGSPSANFPPGYQVTFTLPVAADCPFTDPTQLNGSVTLFNSTFPVTLAPALVQAVVGTTNQAILTFGALTAPAAPVTFQVQIVFQYSLNSGRCPALLNPFFAFNNCGCNH